MGIGSITMGIYSVFLITVIVVGITWSFLIGRFVRRIFTARNGCRYDKKSEKNVVSFFIINSLICYFSAKIHLFK